MREELLKTGIAVIQPPKNGEWDFDSFHKYINSKTFSFVTKSQNVHQMTYRMGSPYAFYQALHKYWSDRGAPLTHYPEVLGITVNLHKLASELMKLGGFEMVGVRSCSSNFCAGGIEEPLVQARP